MQKTARQKRQIQSVDQVVRTLHAHLPELAERFSVKSLGVFGSSPEPGGLLPYCPVASETDV